MKRGNIIARACVFFGVFAGYVFYAEPANAELFSLIIVSAILGAASTGAAAAGTAIAAGATLGAAIASVSIATLAVGAALGAASTLATYLLADKPTAPSGFRNAAATFRAAVLPARWLLGRAKVGGLLAYHGEDDDSRDYDTSKGTHIAQRDMWRVFVVSEGACDGMEALYLNGQKIPLVRRDQTISYGGETRTYERWQAASNAPIGYRQQGSGAHREASLVSVYPVLDAAGNRFLPLEQASASSRFEAPGKWTSAHRLQGVSYIAVKLVQPSAGFRGETGNQKEWTRIPEVQFVVRGIKITWPGQDTPIWTRNAAALRYWWETQRRNIPPAEIDSANFTQAYNICEQEITRTLTQEQIDAGYTATRARYTIDGYVEADDNIRDIEEGFDIAWAGFVVDAGGKRYYRPGATRDPRLTITESDWAEFPTLQPANELTNKINVARASIGQSRHHDYSEFDIGELVDDPAVQRDGVRRARDLGTLPYISDALTGRMIVAALLRGWRYEGFTLSGVLKPGETNALFGLIPTDCVMVDMPSYGYGGSNALRMIVAEREIRPDLSIFVRLHLTALDVYNDATGFPPLVNLAPLPEFDKRVPPVPADIEVSQTAFVTETGSVARKAYIVWSAHGYRAEVRYRIPASDSANDPEWEIAETPDNSAVLTLDKASTYKFAVRHLNRFGVASAWSAEQDIVVAGDLDPPGDITGFTAEPVLASIRISGLLPADDDVRGVEIYAKDFAANGVPPADAPIGEGAVAFFAGEPGAPFSQLIEPTSSIAGARQWRVWARAMDTSGNAGALTAPINIGDPSTLQDHLEAQAECLLVQVRALIARYRDEAHGITQIAEAPLQNVPALSAPSLGSIQFEYIGGDVEIGASIEANISIPLIGRRQVGTAPTHHFSNVENVTIWQGGGTIAPHRLYAHDVNAGSIEVSLYVYLEGAGITTRQIATISRIYGGVINTSTRSRSRRFQGGGMQEFDFTVRWTETTHTYYGPGGTIALPINNITLSAAQLATWGANSGSQLTIRARAVRSILPAPTIQGISVDANYNLRVLRGAIEQNQDVL